ncbi:MAG: CrcB family protein [Acidimicrobiales bacterium]
MELPKATLVALGGMAGAAARWGALELADGSAWALVAVNSLGAFVLGLVAHGLLRGRPDLRLVAGVGFCGAFTTFSTLAVDIARDLDRGATGDAVLLLLVSLVAGLGAGSLGMRGRRRTP